MCVCALLPLRAKACEPQSKFNQSQARNPKQRLRRNPPYVEPTARQKEKVRQAWFQKEVTVRQWFLKPGQYVDVEYSLRIPTKSLTAPLAALRARLYKAIAGSAATFCPN